MDNKQTILESALCLFAKKGYDAVGVQEITAAAGITKPTLYHYFGNKRGLLQSCVANQNDAITPHFHKALHYQGDVPFTLYQLVKTYFRMAELFPDYCRLNLSMMNSFTESEAYDVMLPYLQKERDAIATLFYQASLDHGNMKNREGLYCASFLGVIYSYLRLHFHENMELTEELAFKVVHQFMHGIFS